MTITIIMTVQSEKLESARTLRGGTGSFLCTADMFFVYILYVTGRQGVCRKTCERELQILYHFTWYQWLGGLDRK